MHRSVRVVFPTLRANNTRTIRYGVGLPIGCRINSIGRGELDVECRANDVNCGSPLQPDITASIAKGVFIFSCDYEYICRPPPNTIVRVFFMFHSIMFIFSNDSEQNENYGNTGTKL